MRILFLYLFPLWGNGSGSYIRALSEELVARGHDVAIVSPDKRKLNGIKHYVVPSHQMGVFIGHPELPKAKKWQDMSGKELGDIYSLYLKTAIDAVADFNPEIIHVFHTAFLPGIARVLREIYGIKYIITTHGSDLHYLAIDRRFVGLIKDANKHARFITAVSDVTRRSYLQFFGQHLRSKSKVIMGGVHIEDYRRDEAKIAEIEKKYNLANKKVVLFTGRLIKTKGVVYLIRAAASINGTVLIMGDGPERKVLEEEIKKKKVSNIILMGYINSSDKALFHAIYQRADVYVSPSVWEEPLGLTILEAMASKTPVVATRKGGIVSIIKHGINGYLIPPRNPKEIATTVNMLFANDLLRQEIGEQGYKTILDNFTWGKIAGQFEDIYNKFRYSTKEYLAWVKGVNPKLSHFMDNLNKMLAS